MPLARVAPTCVLERVAFKALAAGAIRAAEVAPADIPVALHAEAGVEIEEGRCDTALVADVDARVHLW